MAHRGREPAAFERAPLHLGDDDDAEAEDDRAPRCAPQRAEDEQRGGRAAGEPPHPARDERRPPAHPARVETVGVEGEGGRADVRAAAHGLGLHREDDAGELRREEEQGAARCDGHLEPADALSPLERAEHRQRHERAERQRDLARARGEHDEQRSRGDAQARAAPHARVEER